MSPEKEQEFIAVRDAALQSPDFKPVQDAAEEIASAFGTFQEAISKNFQIMGARNESLEEKAFEMKGRELQMWLDQCVAHLMREKLFALMGQIGADRRDGDAKDTIQFPGQEATDGVPQD